MGRVGSTAYEFLRQQHGDVVLGIDRDSAVVDLHLEQGRRVILGDATDYDFWARTRTREGIDYALLCFPNHRANLAVAQLFREFGIQTVIASIAKFNDHVDQLKEARIALREHIKH